MGGLPEHFNCNDLPSVVIDLSEHMDEPWHDMHLMSLCRHHIIANSSFSWWGAWLRNDFGLTIAPKHWFADLRIDTSDIIPKSWLQI